MKIFITVITFYRYVYLCVETRRINIYEYMHTKTYEHLLP